MAVNNNGDDNDSDYDNISIVHISMLFTGSEQRKVPITIILDNKMLFKNTDRCSISGVYRGGNPQH